MLPKVPQFNTENLDVFAEKTRMDTKHNKSAPDMMIEMNKSIFYK